MSLFISIKYHFMDFLAPEKRLCRLFFFSFFFSKIAFIREAFPRFSKEDITLVLQSCDCNVETAIACFTNGKC